MGGKFLNFGLGNDFLDETPKVHETKGKIDKRNYIKVKAFCTAKETSNRLERKTYSRRENICQLFIQRGINMQNIRGTQRIQQYEIK